MRTLAVGFVVGLWGLVVFVVGLHVNFPSEALLDRARWEVQDRSDGAWALDAQDARLWRLTGIEVDDAPLLQVPRQSRRDAEDGEAVELQPLVRVDSLAARVHLMPLLTGTQELGFLASIFGGELDGSVGLDETRTHIVASGSGLDLSRMPTSGEEWSIDAAGPRVGHGTRRGYQTAAIVTNPFLSSAVGFDRGFGTWLHVNERAAHRLTLLGYPRGMRTWEGEVVLKRALDWLDAAPERGWFLWVHFLDPHLPYRHVEPGHVARSGAGGELRSGRLFSAEQRAALRDGYAHEVSVVDGFIGQLLDAVPHANVALVSDHGEEWWDHGGLEHGHSHHGEVVDVALALGGPDVPPGEPGAGVVAIQDLTTTLLGLAGLPGAEESFDLRREVPAHRVAVATGNLYGQVDWSARQGDRRIIWRGDGSAPEAYDLAHDAAEHSPMPVDEADPLLGALLEAKAQARRGTAEEANDAALEALGYQ